MTMDAWLLSVDPRKVEAERFSLTPTEARKILRRMYPQKRGPYKRKSRPMPESLWQGLNLSEAQKRAVIKWWKGMK